jgi:hypothetical protein
MEQELASVWLGWLWVDSAATVHNIKDRQSHAGHRLNKRIDRRYVDRGFINCRIVIFPFGIRLLRVYKGYRLQGNVSQVTIETGVARLGVCSRKRTHFKREASMSEPSYEELKAKLAQLEKEVEVKKRSGDLSFKIGEKGGLSVYGLGRFPVTLYYEQWNRLLGAADDIKKFLEENKSKLKLKE